MEEAKKVANENFDWNAFENDLGVYDQPKEQIGEAYDKTLSNIAANEVTEGTVIGINKREVVVNIGYKSEGIIPISEFRYNPDLKVGDKVRGRVVVMADYGAFVEIAPGKDGLVHISKLADKRIEKVEDACKVGDMMWVKVTEIDEKGRVNLSHKDAMREIAAKEANGERVK